MTDELEPEQLSCQDLVDVMVVVRRNEVELVLLSHRTYEERSKEMMRTKKQVNETEQVHQRVAGGIACLYDRMVWSS